MIDRPDARPEIEPYYWDVKGSENLGVLNSKDKPDLIIFDLPYFDKKAEDYAQKSIPRKQQKLPLLMQTGEIFRISPQLLKTLKTLS